MHQRVPPRGVRHDSILSGTVSDFFYKILWDPLGSLKTLLVLLVPWEGILGAPVGTLRPLGDLDHISDHRVPWGPMHSFVHGMGYVLCGVVPLVSLPEHTVPSRPS